MCLPILRSVLVAWLLAAVAVASAACGVLGPGGLSEEPSGAEAPPDLIRYVALGDSIAVGTGSDTSYVEEYAAWLEAETGSTVRTTNHAGNGWTASDLLHLVRTDEAIRTSVAEAHVITINAGGNDLLRALGEAATGGCGGVDGQECLRAAVSGFEASWDDLLAELVEVTDGDLRGVRTMDIYRPAFMAQLGPLTPLLQGYLDAANGHLVAGAEEVGVPVAGVHRAFRDAAGGERSLISTDRLHPNADGHAAIARELAVFGAGFRDVS